MRVRTIKLRSIAGPASLHTSHTWGLPRDTAQHSMATWRGRTCWLKGHKCGKSYILPFSNIYLHSRSVTPFIPRPPYRVHLVGHKSTHCLEKYEVPLSQHLQRPHHLDGQGPVEKVEWSLGSVVTLSCLKPRHYHCRVRGFSGIFHGNNALYPNLPHLLGNALYSNPHTSPRLTSWVMRAGACVSSHCRQQRPPP